MVLGQDMRQVELPDPIDLLGPEQPQGIAGDRHGGQGQAQLVDEIVARQMTIEGGPPFAQHDAGSEVAELGTLLTEEALCALRKLTREQIARGATVKAAQFKAEYLEMLTGSRTPTSPAEMAAEAAHEAQ